MSKKILTGFLVFMLMATASSAWASVEAKTFTLSPFIGGYVFDGMQHLKSRPVYGIRGGYNFTDNIGLEAMFDFVNTKPTRVGNSDVNVYNYRLEGLYHFMPAKKLVPFVAVGVGGISVINKNIGAENLKEAVVDYGAGVKYSLTEDLALRGDVRHLIVTSSSLVDNLFSNIEYTVGITYAFGGTKKAPAPVVKQVMSETLPLDTDGDGILDTLDKCPTTPKGVKVDMVGCALDTDGDGVLDYLDKCPTTPKGVKVDMTGCPSLKRVSISLKLEFDTDKSDVRVKHSDEIGRVAAFMVKYPNVNGVIEGHTDNVGRAKYNLELSQKRAQSVMKYLINKYGVDSQRLSAKGYGSAKPIADNNTSAGRQENRRTEAMFEGISSK